ncbi:hypothetical protein BT63DRAFT_477129, partial [Microthyrium microscopicum]
MLVANLLPLAWLSLATALPALHDVENLPSTSQTHTLERRQRGTADVEAIVGPIGAFMGLMMPFADKLGIDAKGDMTTTLCKTFANNDLTSKAVEAFAGSPNGKGPDEKCMKDLSGGSGPYKSKVFEDPTLANHTIYTPELPVPAGTKLPVVAWANGFCLPAGTMFENFLRELASHGYIVIANGKINHEGKLGATTRAPELLKSITWIGKNPKVQGGYEADLDKIVIAGQSCGGVNVYAAVNKDPRIKMALMFNSGDFGGMSSALIKSIKVPVAYFEGGSKDFAGPAGLKDYKMLTTPALYADAEIGHIGTYYQKYGGKLGKIGIRFLEWKLKGDEKAKAEFCSPANGFHSSLPSENAVQIVLT